MSQEDIVLEYGKSMISFRVRESVVDSQGVSDAEDARNRALGELQNASMEWQRAEVKCEGDHRIRPGMRVTLKYVGERFSGEYVAERVEHEFSAEGFTTEVFLRRNMLPGEPKRAGAIDEERERQHNSASAAKASSQEDAEEQEEEKRPAITNPHWESSDGSALTKALVGDEVYLCADVQDIPDGTSAKIKVVEKDDDGNDDDVTPLTAKVQDGKIKCKWKVIYTEDDDDSNSEQEKAEKGYTLPEYAFTVECGGATSGESGQLDVMGWIKTQFKDKKTGKSISNCKYIVYLLDGSTKTGITNAEGYVEESDLKHGEYFIVFKD